MSSQVSTPNLGPHSSQAVPTTTTSASTDGANPAKTTSPDDDIPPLSLDVLTSHDDKVDALKLVADSIAQQRQLTSLHLVFHPVCLAGLVAGLALAYQYAWVSRHHDLGLTMSMVCGVVMIYLMAIRYVASPYIKMAEDLKWEWLVPEDGSGATEEDTVIGTRFGDDLIGALVLRLEPAPANKKKSARTGANLRGGRGVIRAWTVRLRYRAKGVGSDMLHEAVRVTRDRCGRDADVGFAAEHANSAMVLPEFFNRPFRRREMRAAKALDNVLADWEGNKRKR
jgi:hypothetical protein